MSKTPTFDSRDRQNGYPTLKGFIKRIPFSVALYNSLTHMVRHFKYAVGFFRFQRLSQQGPNRFPSPKWQERYPCLGEDTDTTIFDSHYIYHPAWAARAVAQIQPKVHIDISSTLSFCSIVSAFVPVEFYDYRPAKINLGNLQCKPGDLMKLPFEDGSIESLSCMHVVEHIGLGRYGDALDPGGDLKAIAELKRVLAKGGSLLFVTPVGKPRVRFNAHRIYSYDQVISFFTEFHVEQFALVDDKNQFIINADPAYTNQQEYGCGCWWFKK
jgi:SAM-dependent methyltransferase